MSPRIVSIHQYTLRSGIDPERFIDAVRQARTRGLFDLPGLIEYRFVRRIRGSGGSELAAIWVYESRQAWERLWGPVHQPLAPDAYPDSWKVWENELLRPLLDCDPDKITFAAYEELV